MNEHHANVCPSPEWAEQLQSTVLPWVTRDVDLGRELLEIGPGPGAATDWLRHRVQRLVAVEHEAPAADRLRERFAGGNVEVVTGDATTLTFDDASFDSAAMFTMLHHVPTTALQDRLLAEVHRVLRPGGALIGSDSVGSDTLHQFHADDVYNPVDPATFYTRLQTLGYERITISVDGRMRFIAYKPASDES